MLPFAPTSATGSQAAGINVASRTLSFSDATLEAMREEMRRDHTVFLMGEGHCEARWGLRSVQGFAARVRVRPRSRDTPISEAALMGAGVGAALTGCRPIVDMHFADFITCAMDEVVNQAAKLRYMFGEQCIVPLTVRAPRRDYKVGRLAALAGARELVRAHAGLEVVIPADPKTRKAASRRRSASNNPTLYFEHKMLFPTKGEVPDDDDFVIPIGKAKTMRDGTDVAIVTYGITVGRALAAAAALEQDGNLGAGAQPAHSLAARLRCDRGRRRAHAPCRRRARSGAGRRRRRGRSRPSSARRASTSSTGRLFRLGSAHVPVPFAAGAAGSGLSKAPMIADAARRLVRRHI